MTGTQFIVFVGAVILVPVWLAMFVMHKKGKRWKLLTEGVYERVEYGEYPYTRRHGAMVHTTSHHIMQVTVVHFSDSRTCVLNGRRDMTFPKGTTIKILENGLEHRKIVV